MAAWSNRSPVSSKPLDDLLKSSLPSICPFQEGRPVLVGSSRSVILSTGSRCRSRRHVVLDRYARGIRLAGGLSVILAPRSNPRLQRTPLRTKLSRQVSGGAVG